MKKNKIVPRVVIGSRIKQEILDRLISESNKRGITLSAWIERKLARK